MNLIQALTYFDFKKADKEGLKDYDEEEDMPERSVKKYALIPESTHNSRLSVPCHPEYLKFIYLNNEKDYFNDFKTSEINKLIKRINIIIEDTIELKNSIEFDNHYKSEDNVLSVIFWIGIIFMGAVYAFSIADICNSIFLYFLDCFKINFIYNLLFEIFFLFF